MPRSHYPTINNRREKMCFIKFVCEAFTVRQSTMVMTDMDSVTEDWKDLKKILVIDTNAGQYLFNRYYKEEDGSYTIPEQLAEYTGP